MKERPILFSTDMVSATLDNRKTNTRRLRGLDLINKHPDDWQCFGMEIDPELVPHDGDLDDAKECKGLYAHFEHNGDPESWPGFDHTSIKCPYGQPGDLLYVRESIYSHPAYSAAAYKKGLCGPLFGEDGKAVAFRGYMADLDPNATDQAMDLFRKTWRIIPSIHMPKRAARIWLRITDIRAERVQDISEEDAMAEGSPIVVSPVHYYYHLDWFKNLWIQINGRESYDLNPWVWVITFEVLSTTGRPESLIKSMKAESIN